MPLLTLLGQVSLSKTIGGTTQLGSLSSTGGLVVTSTITVGGTDQLEVLTSTGGLDVTSTLTIGGTDQLSAITSTGTIQVGDVGHTLAPLLRTVYTDHENRQILTDIENRNIQ